MAQLPQLFEEARPTPVEAPAPASPVGHVRRRARKRDRAMTSVEMTFDERARLDRLAAQRRASIGSILRRGVVLVEEIDEAMSPAEREVLEQLETAGGVSLAEVVRRGIASVAAEREQTTQGVAKAA